MIFFSLGLPSRFAWWCDAVMAQLVQQKLGPAEVLWANTLEEFTVAAIKAGSPHILVTSRLTVGTLQRALAQANKRFMVALDDPRLALEDLVVHSGMDFVEATRAVARSCASMATCATIPGALVLSAREEATNPLAIAADIARHFKLGTDESDVGEIVAALADLGMSPGREEGNFWWDHLEEAQRALATGALDPYVARLAGGDLGPIIWERELFFINEEQSEEQRQLASRPVDITGRSRFLVHGPYITLPPGSWSATVSLGFSEEAAEMSYVVDVYTDVQLAQARIEPAGQRLVETILHFSIAEPLSEPIVVRISNERAAFHGRLALGHVTITPHTSLRPGTRNYFAAALGT